MVGFNFLVAAGLTLSGVIPDSFLSAALDAQCIGLSIFAVHCALSAVWLPLPRLIQEPVRILVAAPLGYWIGSAFGSIVLHESTPEVLLSGVPRFQLVVTVVASVCMVYFIWSRDRILEESAAHAKAQQLASEAELRLLRAQIEPHMLFNTLANLRYLVGVDRGRAEEMIDQLIIFLRSSLSASRTEMRSLSAEFEQLHAYLGLMKIRMAERLNYQLDCPHELGRAMIPAMLLQPLVENAIKHGLEPAIGGGQLTVRARQDGNQLVLEVLDSGVGLSEVDPAGYGLAHIRERLAALYKSSATFSIAGFSDHGGTIASLHIPLDLAS